MKKAIFTGCSFTAGTGWFSRDPKISNKEYPGLWVNVCHKKIPALAKSNLLNLSESGSSNTEIFEQTTKAMGAYPSDIDTIICQWTAGPRYKFDAGFELWDTSESIQPSMRRRTDIKTASNIWSRGYVDDLLDRLFAMHHLHREIVKIVEYSNILQNLAQQLNIKLYFINGLCPWDQNYFVNVYDTTGLEITTEQFTEFTKKTILNSNLRSNEDNIKLYKKIHSHYKGVGGINPAQWVNLYDSMFNNIIDVNHDNKHPGTKSNELYIQQVKNFFTTQ